MGKLKYNKPEIAVLKPRIDTYENWTKVNPILNLGDTSICIDIPEEIIKEQVKKLNFDFTDISFKDIYLIKIGNGKSSFNELEFKFVSLPLK